MSKVTMTYDTEDKTFTVSIDGTELDNVSSLSAYGGEYGGISISQESKVGDMRQCIYICAKNEQNKDWPQSAHAGFVLRLSDEDFAKRIAQVFQNDYKINEAVKDRKVWNKQIISR